VCVLCNGKSMSNTKMYKIYDGVGWKISIGNQCVNKVIVLLTTLYISYIATYTYKESHLEQHLRAVEQRLPPLIHSTRANDSPAVAQA
jgi:hypothetical protein